MRSSVGVILVAACVTVATGCAGERVPTAATPMAAVDWRPQLAGTWSMDLSPEQDRSYLKDFVVTPDEPRKAGEIPVTFSGLAYGASPFANGLVSARGDRVVFSCMTDESGEMGGPYFWLGSTTADGAIEGDVRSIKRGFEMRWRAVRAGGGGDR